MLRSPPRPIACWTDSAEGRYRRFPIAVRATLLRPVRRDVGLDRRRLGQDTRHPSWSGGGDGDAEGARRRRPLRAVPAHGRHGARRVAAALHRRVPSTRTRGSRRSSRSHCCRRRSSARPARATSTARRTRTSTTRSRPSARRRPWLCPTREPGAGGHRRLLQSQPARAVQPNVPDHLRRRKG